MGLGQFLISPSRVETCCLRCLSGPLDLNSAIGDKGGNRAHGRQDRGQRGADHADSQWELDKYTVILSDHDSPYIALIDQGLYLV